MYIPEYDNITIYLGLTQISILNPTEEHETQETERARNPDGSVWNPFDGHPHPDESDYEEYWAFKRLGMFTNLCFARPVRHIRITEEVDEKKPCIRVKSEDDSDPELAQSCLDCDEKTRQIKNMEAKLTELRDEHAQAQNMLKDCIRQSMLDIEFFLQWRPLVLREAQGRIKLLEGLLEANGQAVPDDSGLQMALSIFERAKHTMNDEGDAGGEEPRKRVKVEVGESSFGECFSVYFL